MAPNRNKRVNVPLTDSEKEKWDSVTEEGERFSSLAELVRTSVYRELEGHHDDGTAKSEYENAALADSIEKMAGTLSQLESTVSDIETRLDRLEGKVTTDGPEMELDSLIYDLLPVKPEAGEGLTSTELANRYGLDQQEVSHALDRLTSRTSTVVMDQPPKGAVGISEEADESAPRYYYRTDDGGQ